jgi:8-oxo-dGTP pyrophosphatase MutT (NUDIX family)
MIKVFSLNKIIYLIESKTLFHPKEGAVLVSIHTKDEMRLIHDELINKSNVNEIYFFNKDLKKLFGYFADMFRIIEAAGGLVKNKKGEWLFIFRNGKWDLPKGKIEKKEAVKTAAIREVEEECGIKGLNIVKELPITYHTYYMEEKRILKRTYWFEMMCDDHSKLVPQTEEGITDAKWLSATDLQQVVNNTYESVMEVMKEIG